MKNVFAYTADGYMPEYISINEDAHGFVTVTVRGRERETIHGPQVPQADMALPRPEIAKMVAALVSHGSAAVPFWLIERPFHSRAYYWAAPATPVEAAHAQGHSGSLDHWSSKEDDALRFARRQDAEAMLARVLGAIGSVVERGRK